MADDKKVLNTEENAEVMSEYLHVLKPLRI